MQRSAANRKQECSESPKFGGSALKKSLTWNLPWATGSSSPFIHQRLFEFSPTVLCLGSLSRARSCLAWFSSRQVSRDKLRCSLLYLAESKPPSPPPPSTPVKAHHSETCGKSPHTHTLCQLLSYDRATRNPFKWRNVFWSQQIPWISLSCWAAESEHLDVWKPQQLTPITHTRTHTHTHTHTHRHTHCWGFTFVGTSASIQWFVEVCRWTV